MLHFIAIVIRFCDRADIGELILVLVVLKVWYEIL